MCLESTPLPEEWRPVVGFEGFYEVSNLGRVKRIKACNASPTERILKLDDDRSGYLTAALYRDGVKTRVKAHILIARAFVGGYRPGLQVNHLNGVKRDNRSENLEWVTGSENQRHAVRIGLSPQGLTHFRAKYLPLEVVAYIKHMRGVVLTRVLSKQIGVSQSMISRIQRGVSWHTHDAPNPPSLSCTDGLSRRSVASVPLAAQAFPSRACQKDTDQGEATEPLG